GGFCGYGHVHQPAEPESEQDSLLDPRHRAPRSVFASNGRTHLPRFERLEKLIENSKRIVPEVRDVVLGGHSTDAFFDHQRRAPAARRALRTVSVCASASGTSGRRRLFSIFPSSAIAAFTGSGLDSTNSARIHGR